MELRHPSPRLGLLIRLLDVQLSKLSAQRLQALGISLAEMTTLSLISGKPGVRSSELADAMLIKAPNMSKIINRLESAGFIRRVAARDDGRAVALSLLPRGQDAVRFGVDTAHDVERDALSGLSEEDQTRFMDAIGLALANLQILAGAADEPVTQISA